MGAQVTPRSSTAQGPLTPACSCSSLLAFTSALPHTMAYTNLQQYQHLFILALTSVTSVAMAEPCVNIAGDYEMNLPGVTLTSTLQHVEVSQDGCEVAIRTSWETTARTNAAKVSGSVV